MEKILKAVIHLNTLYVKVQSGFKEMKTDFAANLNTLYVKVQCLIV